MCKKLLFLISFVLVLVLAGSASAAAKFDYRACWWSDLDPANHDWNEPNNWWTMDRYWDDDNDDDIIDTSERKFYVKEPNQVPDVNTVVFVGKGTPRIDYPEYLHFNPPPFEPVINSGTAEANNVWVGGGYSQDPNGDEWPDLDLDDPNHWDPCLAHELTVNGGTLNIGTPQTWEGYDTQYDTMYGTMQSMGYFNGMFSGSCLRLGTVGWWPPVLGEGTGQGTMNMNGGTVNVGGHMEVGAWEHNIGTLNMTDGEINITQGLYCPSAWDSGGRVMLSGGTINARYIFMNDFECTDASIDIAGGKFILSRGNEVEELTDYSNGIGTLYGDLGIVSLTAYGVGDGDIITDGNYGAALGKRADLSIDYDVSNEGKTTVQAFTTDPNQAWNPSPPNGAGNVKGTVANIERPVLSWSPGDGATSHEVYFDANEALVSARDESVLKQSSYALTSWTVDSDLTSFHTYYWVIDENPGPTLGQVWSFTMADLAKAGPPSPEDGATDVNPVVNLSWGAGIYAVTHDVYFSTDFNDVNDRDPNALTNQPTNNYDPPGNGLEFSTTYYWRVDECNDSNDPLWPGDVWRFTTYDHILVDNFDSYANHTAIRAVWRDYYYDPKAANRAELFIEKAPELVRDGNSMRYYFRNIKVGGKLAGCEAEASAADLEVGTDWTASGVEALVLYFYGDATNLDDSAGVINGIHQDQMYVALEDGDDGSLGIVKYPDMNAIAEESWQEWNIDLADSCLADVNMANIAKVYIGFGGQKIGQTVASVTGDTVWFDDIGLWPIRCVPAESLAADFTGDCVVDEQDLDIMAGDWLASDYSLVATAPSDVNLVARWEFEGDYTDSNGSYDGVPYGDVDTVYDAVRGGDVLTCDGDGDYVEIPGSNTPGGVFDIRNDITLSAWIKLSVIDNSWPAIIAKGDDDWGWRIARNGKDSEVLEFACAGISGGALEPYGNVVGSVPVVDGLWHHAAGVYDGSKVCVYVDGIVDNCEDGSGLIAPSSVHVRIGSNENAKTTAWTGYIDDVRVYNCALQPGEIMALAGREPYVQLDVPANLSPKVGPYGWDPNNLDIINFLDYGKLAEDWLKESPFPPRP